MKEEKIMLDVTRNELIEYYKIQKKLCNYEEYLSMRTSLLDRVKRVLDLRDSMKITRSNNKNVRKIINKYAKQYKQELEVKKLLKKQKNEENMIEQQYALSVIDLMEIVYDVLCEESFQRDLPALEKWYGFEMEDMVLVNDVIRILRYYNSSNVTEEDILDAINYAVQQYIYCIENDIEYMDKFGGSFPFVYLMKQKQGECQ